MGEKMSIIINNKETKTYIVLGAPHSATSFMAKCLQKCGINMGKRMHPDLYQDKDFVGINQKILGKTSGYWHTPPSDEEIKKIDVSDSIKKVIKKKKSKFWGFKDPRTVLTIDHYLPHLEDNDTYLICIFRKPKRVLKSYKHDKRITEDIIKIYNKKIIETIKRFCNV